LEKTPKAWNSSQNNCQTQICQNIYNKAQFESPKHQRKATFRPKNTCNKSYFIIACLGENLKSLLKQKVAQKVAISLGYFISKSHNCHSKVAKFVKNCRIRSP